MIHQGAHRRLKHPVTLGAAETLKVLVLNPYQLAWHGSSIRLAMCKKQNSVQMLAHAKIAGLGVPCPKNWPLLVFRIEHRD